MLSSWGLSLRIVGVTFRAQLEYRADFWLRVGFGVAYQASIIVFATVLLGRFPAMGGWSADAVLLIASMRMLSHGLFELFYGRVGELAVLVQQGHLDGFLLRPMSVYRQVQLSHFPSNALGDLLVGVSMFVGAIVSIDLDWTPWRIGYAALAVVGGMLMEAAIVTLVSILHMYFPAALAWSYWIGELMGIFGNYPLKILPSVIAGFFTYVLPLAFVAYLPVAVLTGYTAGLGVPIWLAVASPVVGLLAFIASRLLWNVGLRRYTGVNG